MQGWISFLELGSAGMGPLDTDTAIKVLSKPYGRPKPGEVLTSGIFAHAFMDREEGMKPLLTLEALTWVDFC